MSWNRWGPLAVGAGMMALSIALRAGTFSYHGHATQPSFNRFASSHLGGYSDIASLYFRNHMWHHHLPYVHYPFEYPVGTGLFAWVTSLVGSGVGAYLAINAAVLVLCGLLTIWLLGRLPNANPWLLALAPALALYAVLNWDLLAIAALMLALVLFHQRRDRWGATALAVATWTKFFPIIALPVVLLVRILDGRGTTPRDRARTITWILLPFAAVTVAINAPFLIAHTSRWLYFFNFNTMRRGGGGLWALFNHGYMAVSTENRDSAVLLLAGVAFVFATIVWASRRRGTTTDELIGPAMLACFGWFFLTIKLYSPQYDLWVLVLAAVAGAPVVLAVAFAAADVGYFTTAFTQFRVNNLWVEIHVLRPVIVIREAAVLAIVAWAVWTIIRAGRRRVQRLEVAEPEPLPVLAGTSG